MTAHAPMPLTTEDSFGRIVAMILGPVSSSTGSFNSIVIYAVKIGRGNRCWRPRRNHVLYHDAISAGALAIRIPKRFKKAIEESPFEWRRLNGNIPIVDDRSVTGGVSHSDDDTILYSLPPTSRITTGSFKLFPSSNKLKSAFAILQLVYSAVQAYMQYEQMIHSQGLSSPFIIAIAYLYMSFINLIANLVQGSYTHVTIISSMPTTIPSMSLSSAPIIQDSPTNDSSLPTTMVVIAAADQTDPSGATSTSEFEAEESGALPELESSSQGPDETNQQQPQSHQPLPEELQREFENWLQTHYPQIEFDDYPRLSSIAFFMHYSIALFVILTWIGLLTGFRPGTNPLSNISPSCCNLGSNLAHFVGGGASVQWLATSNNAYCERVRGCWYC